MNKKIYYMLIFLIMFMFFPLISRAQEQGTVTCIYTNTSKENYLQIDFYAVGTASPLVGDIDYYTFDNSGNKKTIFATSSNAEDYFINYRKKINEIPVEYAYASEVILSQFSEGKTAITENNKELVCPSKFYILEKQEEKGWFNKKVETVYNFYACGNNYGDYKNDTCAKTISYLQGLKNGLNYDGSNASLSTVNYYTGNIISNVNKKDPTKTNVQDGYNNNQTEIENYCDQSSKNYDKEKCDKANVAQGALVSQAETNLNVSKSELEKGYGNFVANNNIKFDGGDTCNALLGDIKDPGAPAYYLDFTFKVIKYLAIVLLFVLTLIEFIKATASNDQDAIKKASRTTLKRIIIAIIIFVLPILINFVLKTLGVVSTNGTCGIGVNERR